MTKKAHCQACSNERHGVKTRKAVPHTCGKKLCDIIKEKKEHEKRKERVLKKIEEAKEEGVEDRKKSLLATMEIIKSGFAGVMPNGNIVDRRIHPEAVPIPENPMLNTPKPKDI